MKRIGFFKAIAGGVAALAGFKPVEGFCICKAVFVKPKGMGVAIGFTPLTRLQKAIQEETERMKKRVPDILEERQRHRNELFGLKDENKT